LFVPTNSTLFSPKLPSLRKLWATESFGLQKTTGAIESQTSRKSPFGCHLFNSNKEIQESRKSQVVSIFSHRLSFIANGANPTIAGA
jgi:hypothetical protein